MATVFIRTIIIYLVFLLTFRIMGKRQVGELQISELVITFMLSELAVNPIQDMSIPILYAIIPLIVLISFEVVLSFLITKSPRVKKLLVGNPSFIIKKGRLDQRELSKLRMGLSELIGELRLKDVKDIADVDYAILEENGKLSVFQKPSANQNNSGGIGHAIIIDGCVNESNLKQINKTNEWLRKYLKKKGLMLKSIFLMTCDDSGTTNIIIKEKI